MEEYAIFLWLKNVFLKDEHSDFFKNADITFNDMDFNKANQIGIYIKSGLNSDIRLLNSFAYCNESVRVQIFMQGNNEDTSDNGKHSTFDILRYTDYLKRLLRFHIGNFINRGTDIDFGIESNNKLETLRKLEDGSIVTDDYPDSENLDFVKILILRLDLLGDLNYVGKTTQGYPQYSLNFNITFNIN